MKAAIGRPTSLTPKLREKIVALIRVGNYPSVAARAAGIGRATFFQWMARGRKGEQPFADFADAVNTARGDAESFLVGVIQSAAAGGDWKAAARMLEAMTPRWARCERVEKVVEDRRDPKTATDEEVMQEVLKGASAHFGIDFVSQVEAKQQETH